MLESPTSQQQQVWVLQRLHRICVAFRNSAAVEPCLEQYEYQVQLLTGQQLTPAATAWIEVIVHSLRADLPFVPEEHLGCADSVN